MFGAKIKENRVKLGLRQQDLAEKIGVTQTNIAQWENDRICPTHENVVKLATAFGISIDTLYDFNIHAADIWANFINLTDEQKKTIYMLVKSLAMMNETERRAKFRVVEKDEKTRE